MDDYIKEELETIEKYLTSIHNEKNDLLRGLITVIIKIVCFVAITFLFNLAFVSNLLFLIPAIIISIAYIAHLIYYGDELLPEVLDDMLFSIEIIIDAKRKIKEAKKNIQIKKTTYKIAQNALLENKKEEEKQEEGNKEEKKEKLHPVSEALLNSAKKCVYLSEESQTLFYDRIEEIREKYITKINQSIHESNQKEIVLTLDTKIKILKDIFKDIEVLDTDITNKIEEERQIREELEEKRKFDAAFSAQKEKNKELKLRG